MDCWGDEFEQLYAKYEKEGRGRKTIKAQALWYKIIEAQIEVGVPYMLYKVRLYVFICILYIVYRMLVTVNQINKILEQSNVRIFVLKLLNIPIRTR